MTIAQIDGKFAIVRLDLAPAEIPDLLQRHAWHFPGTDGLEEAGGALVATAFDAKASRAFVKRVCEWGKGHRLVARVLGNNTEKQIASALREGYADALDGRVAEGVERISGLNYLGQSFASKQLRFIAPTLAVILDSVLRTRLGYEETASGYSEFLADCRALLGHAQKSDQLETGFRAKLRICDIETALFARIQGY